MARILVIDDQPHVRAAISLVLQAKKFDVVAVDAGAAGLREFQAEPFDLAIVDIFMPGMDGVKLIKELRLRRPDLPVIAISGVALGPSGRTALELLPMAPDLPRIICLQKPFRPSDLLRAIADATAIATAA